MKRLAQLAFATVSSVALILSGCSQQAAKPADQPKAEAKKELTPVEVLIKANEVFDKGAFTYEGKLNQKMTAASQSMDMNMDFTMDMTSQPYAVHMKGKVNMMGQSMPMEIYQAGQDMYFNVGPSGWMKSSGQGAPSSGEKPNEIMKKLAKFIEELGGKTLPDGIKVTKEGNDWVVETDYAVLMKNKSFVADVQEQIKETLDPESLKKDGINVDLGKVNLSLFKEKVWIDGTTFQAKKINEEIKLTVPAGKAELKFDGTMDLALKGEFKGKIEVPEQVKKTAKPE